MRGPEDPGGPLPGRRTRLLLSLLLLLHWGSVCWYLAPTSRAGVEALPAWLQPGAGLLFPGVLPRAAPVAGAWLDLTATRQHWTLFAPWPANWASSIRAVPYFPDAHGGWYADTVIVRGAPEAPYPHVLHHRTYRILFNLGYDGFGAQYRPYFARALCRSLRTAGGEGPEGVALEAVWEATVAPWEEGAPEPYRQRLGGYRCADVADLGPTDGPVGDAWAWRPYRLPAPVPVEGWPRVLPGEAGPAGEGGAEAEPRRPPRDGPEGGT